MTTQQCKLIAALYLCAAILAPSILSAATLQAGSSAWDSAAVVATCLTGAYQNGDVRGCADNSGLLSNATPISSVYSASSASYSTGITTQAWASGTLGTLHAFAQTDIPSADAIGHNVQSSAQVDMNDTLMASSSLGSLYNNYQYTVNISGSTTAPSALYAAPSFSANAIVGINIFDNTTLSTLAHQYWSTSSSLVASGGGVLTGMLSGVAAGDSITLDLFLQVGSGVGTNAAGQSGFAQADYSNTVHFYLDALTPGANTVALSGYDYATPAAVVPVPSAVWLFGSGLLGLVGVARRKAA